MNPQFVGTVLSTVSAGGPVAMLFIMEPTLFYGVGGIIILTCVTIIFSTVFGCWKREQRLKELDSRAKRRKHVIANNVDGGNGCCGSHKQ